MTNLVDTHPLVAVDAKITDLGERRRAFEQNVAPLAAEDAKAEEEYDKAVNVALLQGGPMPSPPVRKIPPGRDVELRLALVEEQHSLTEVRRRAVAAAYPDVLREARRQATKLAKAARPTVEKLTAVMADVGELLDAVQNCRSAKNMEAPEGFRQFHDSRLTIEEFVRLVASGDDPTSILDLTGAGKVEPHRNGLTSGLTLGAVQEMLSRA